MIATDKKLNCEYVVVVTRLTSGRHSKKVRSEEPPFEKQPDAISRGEEIWKTKIEAAIIRVEVYQRRPGLSDRRLKDFPPRSNAPKS